LLPAVIGGWRRRAEPAARFLLAWLVPAWIVLELVPTKLPHYALPLYPALALLAAMALTGEGAPRWARVINGVLWLLATIALAVALIVLPMRFGSGVMVAGIVGGVAMVALAGMVLYRQPSPGAKTALLAVLALAFVIPAAIEVPYLDRLWLSRDAAALIARHPPPTAVPLTVIGYNEPSLVFLLRNELRSAMPDMPVSAGGEALVSSRDTAAFEKQVAAQGLAARAIDNVDGTDYSNGQTMTLTLYQIAPK
jgi:4-amino-4-deoxy-L-arabinose transferase-like glycosyltransferase